MTRGSTREYRSGPKDNVTRWGWNRVLERTAGTEKTLPILYLAGPRDFDRRIAVSKGVPPTNLLAIDNYQRNVNQVRRSGGVAICADAAEVLIAWPEHKPVSAVVLDLCCGLEPKLVANIINGVSRMPFAEAVVWINLQRGRDGAANFIRADLARLFGAATKNRAKQFYLTLLLAHIAYSQQDGTLSPAFATADDYLTASIAHHRPVFQSYKSGYLTFDSVVFSLRLSRVLKARAPAPQRHVQRLVSAALAVRTMREDTW